MAKPRGRRARRAPTTTQRFNVVVESDEDGWLVGRVVELPGCHTQAKSLAQLEQRIREAIELYLEVEGEPPMSKFVGLHQIEVHA